MADHLRSSSRIPKQLAILLVGSDMEGKAFSEETKTVVLSRHGAGIVSQYTLSAEQELIIRVMDTDKEAEVRVVGQLASEDGRYIYGVAFLDPTLDFWDIEFPPITTSEKEAGRRLLECSSCKGRETVDHTDVESDVFTINQGVVRYCKRCGSSTMWKLPSVAVEPQPVFPQRQAAPGPQPVAAQVEQPPNAPPSVTLEPVTATTTTLQHSGRAENRRKHVRTRVHFKGCVRYLHFADDIVSCEDMSRGGLRFKSSKRYSEKSIIEVAAPYSPGSPSIFVSAQIVFVQELPNEKLFRYGVTYLLSHRHG
jgi:hypothetical protein